MIVPHLFFGKSTLRAPIPCMQRISKGSCPCETPAKKCPKTFSFRALASQLVLFPIPTRCRDLHLKQFSLEDIVPAVLIILITHIIVAVRWMLIKILSVVINGQGSHKVIALGGCCLNVKYYTQNRLLNQEVADFALYS